MTDIIDRLRAVHNGLFWPEARDAADEITRLRASLAESERIAEHRLVKIDGLLHEVEELREEVAGLQIKLAIPPKEMLIDVHAELRAKERFDRDLTDADKIAMATQIQSGSAFYVATKHNARKVKIWLVWWPSANRLVGVFFRQSKVLSVLPWRSLEHVHNYLARPVETVDSGEKSG